ncbi:aspartate/glutamate racemase family protein [Actinomadura xylanilytica]|uniref:aspartate/glutamate racemase family protein n=1 Tax=Actinomadura xylanilytica TaxID=887459 RepID=UPI00255A97F6|nr:aspartate/glutamate racemase family protein [Actinomadura xylanilytica]MDL4774202.1 aspartate/glutamate racemase family protein [Actinomadura xylanilytica]
MAVPAEGLAAFADQLPEEVIDPGVEVEFAAPTQGAANMIDSAYERTICDVAVLAVGARAADRGFAAVVVNSMSDSGLSALRSRLTIPVVGACQASMAVAGLLGHRIGVVTMWPQWHALYPAGAAASGLADRLVSIRDIGTRPDAEALLTGREDTLFPQLLAACRAAIDQDGAQVLILGSTTMHESHRYLSARLEVPLINPGVVAHQTAQQLLRAGLTHSRPAYPSPARPADDLLDAFIKRIE